MNIQIWKKKLIKSDLTQKYSGLNPFMWWWNAPTCFNWATKPSKVSNEQIALWMVSGKQREREKEKKLKLRR